MKFCTNFSFVEQLLDKRGKKKSTTFNPDEINDEDGLDDDMSTNQTTSENSVTARSSRGAPKRGGGRGRGRGAIKADTAAPKRTSRAQLNVSTANVC